MSLSVCPSRQEIRYSSGGSCTYYGWYLSGSGDSMSVHPFISSAERDRFVERVGAAMPGYERWAVEEAAAMLAFGCNGDHESDRECGYDELERHYPEVSEPLRELADDWDLRGEPAEAEPGISELLAEAPAEAREALSQRLDEDVHELKGQEAARINNGGLHAQVEFLGEARVRDVLRAERAEAEGPLAALVEALSKPRVPQGRER